MKTLDEINKTREYLDYIEDHIKNVNKAWKLIQEKCKDMSIVVDDYYFNLLDIEVYYHDESKLSEQEFVQYRKAFYPTKDEIAKGKYDMSEAWEHHKSLNPHHWETWAKDGQSKGFPYLNVWEVHCTHMVIDWIAMSFAMGGTAQEYYEKNKDRIKLPVYAVDYIYEIFKRVYTSERIK